MDLSRRLAPAYELRLGVIPVRGQAAAPSAQEGHVPIHHLLAGPDGRQGHETTAVAAPVGVSSRLCRPSLANVDADGRRRSGAYPAPLGRRPAHLLGPSPFAQSGQVRPSQTPRVTSEPVRVVALVKPARREASPVS